MPVLGILASTQIASRLSSFDSIQTINVTSSVSSVTFSSIPSTYKHLQIRVIARYDDTGSLGSNDLSWRANSDSGSNYARHRLYGVGSTTGSSGATSVTYAASEYGMVPNAAYSSGVFGVAIIDVLDYANTSKYKTFRLFGGVEQNVNDINSRIGITSNLWQSTSAISSLNFFIGPGTGNFVQYSQFALYGIKG